MKVQLLFRGPLRPSSEAVGRNMKEWLSHLDQTGWQSQNISFVGWMSEGLPEHYVDNVILRPDWTDEDIREIFKAKSKNNKRGAWKAENAFRQYYSVGHAANALAANPCAHPILMIRGDTRPTGTPAQLKRFFELSRPNCYNTCDPFYAGMNDQIGMATPTIFKEVWGWEGADELAARYEDAENPEEALLRRIVARNIPICKCPIVPLHIIK